MAKLRLVREERSLLDRGMALLESCIPPPHEPPIFSTTNWADFIGLQLALSDEDIPFSACDEQLGSLFQNAPWCPWELVVPPEYRSLGLDLVHRYESAQIRRLYLVRDKSGYYS
ncbi:MAG: hypothetical protein AABX70_07275 [Nanoarchaeota archaeon]